MIGFGLIFMGWIVVVFTGLWYSIPKKTNEQEFLDHQ